MKWWGQLLLMVLTAGGGLVAAAESFPEQTLRGFGPVAAEYTENGANSSILTVRTAAADKAALWQAKYHSDLTRTVGRVTEREFKGPRGAFHGYEFADGNGCSVAVRVGKTLHLAYGRTPAELVSTLIRAGITPTAENTRSTAAIPMFLDSFDQYAFRFYYRPDSAPGDVPYAEYDPQQEFDFAAKLGKLGFVFWAEIHNADFAAGLFNDHKWNWAYRLARQRKLPVVLNTNFTSGPSIANHFREDNVVSMPGYAGSFHSVGDPFFGGVGTTSWASGDARKAELQQLQQLIRKYGGADEVIEFLEPHGELNHGAYTVFLEDGPLVDRSFREFLKERYGTLDAVSQRYFGRPGVLKSWEQLRLPAIAEFAGWNERLLDLAGEWRIGYLKLKPGQPEPNTNNLAGDNKFEAEPTPPEYYRPDFDDSDWPRVRHMPGSDQSLFLPKQPAVLRRQFTLKQKPEERIWLYLWDLNCGQNDEVEIHLNGKKIATDPMRHATPHWGAYEVTGALQAGKNLLAVRLPKGAIAYQVYLSRAEPRKYPFVKPGWNARWVDFSDWQGWSRNRAVEQGVAAIREVEPDKSIVSMAPDTYTNQLREIARRYGAHFHNTGYMTAFFAEYLPMLMRGADLPFTLEPSQPARNLTEFKGLTGLCMIEGVNAIHYFIHVGNIYWDPEIREYFEKILPALKLLGQQHQEKSDLAVLFDSDINALLGYPWLPDGNVAYPSGYWMWRFNETLMRDYPIDALVPADFTNGLADRYRIIFDANNTVMRPETIKGIEQWVRNGGIFVAMTQTGRHSPEEADSWPIRELTGYQALAISEYDERNNPKRNEEFGPLRNQSVFNPGDFPEWQNGDGVKLKSIASDTTPLLRWRDGSVAAGMRKLGKGWVITFGLRTPTWYANTYQLLTALLRWAEARPLELVAEAPLIPRHYLSNNGLYDIWVLWNSDLKKSVPYRFHFRRQQPGKLTDLLSGRPGDLSGELPPLEFKVLTSPRTDPARAARRWFLLQCGRWQGAEKPPVTVNDRKYDYTRNTLSLNGDWEVRELDADASITKLLRTDEGWSRRELGPWLLGSEVKGDRFLARRTFTVPPTWKDGEILFWCSGNYLDGAIDGRYKVYLDGKEIADPGPNRGVGHLKLDLKPGATATLALEIQNRHARFRGLKGDCFLSFLPKPDRELDLSGTWEAFAGIQAAKSKAQKLPGEVVGSAFRRTVRLPKLAPGTRVFLKWTSDSDLLGVLVNGHYVRRHHHRIGELTWLDVTPWIRAGAENELTLLPWDNRPDRRGWLREIKFQFYSHQP